MDIWFGCVVFLPTYPMKIGTRKSNFKYLHDVYIAFAIPLIKCFVSKEAHIYVKCFSA